MSQVYDSAGLKKSAGGAVGAADGVNIIAAGTQTAGTTGTVMFSNSNGITFGMSNSSVVTASHNGLTNIKISAGTESHLGSAVTLADANGISFGLNASTITASHNGLTSQSNQNVTAANGGFAFQTLSFSNANNFSFGTSAGSAITGSYTVPTVTNSSWTVSDNVTSLTVAQLAFTNANGVTLTLSTTTGGSATVVGSHNGLTSQSNQALSAANGSFTFQTAQFHNSNGISWSTTTGSGIVASHNGITSQSNQQVTLFATGNTTLSSTGTSNASSLIFRGSGAASVGITNGSVLIDVAAGAAAITQSIGMSTQTAGGGTGGTTGYVTGDDILYHFVPGSNITMSQSVNGASGTLSIYGPAAGGGITYSGFDPHVNQELVSHGGSNATLYLHHVTLPAVQFNHVGVWFTHSNASNSSGSATLSAHIGIYTRNASSLSLLASTSATIAYTGSGTAGSYSQFGGIKIWAIPWTTTLSASNYWIGRLTRATAGGANMTFGAMGLCNAASTWSGFLGSASNATNFRFIGQGVYSATLSTLPAAISLTQVNANSSGMHRQPAFAFLSDVF